MTETARGIDISRYQGKPDFARVKKEAGFVIMQAGFGRYASQKDAEFERNYAECRRYGIPCGAYWFSYAASADDARNEAKACAEVIRGKQFEYPIYYDIEGSACSGDVSAKCRAFCSELEKLGWFAGIYISRSPAQTYLDSYCTANYALWLAEYGSRLNWTGDVGMWQNSPSGRVSGITGDVDTDICFVDYPALIRSGGFNGFEKPSGAETLDKTGYRRGDRSLGVYACKQMLILAKSYGIIGQTLDDNGSFGTGTEKATNALLGKWGYEQNGIAGEKLMKRLREEIEKNAK